MKSLRLDRWATTLHAPRNPRLCLLAQPCPFSNDTRPRRQHLPGRRRASTAAAVQQQDDGLPDMRPAGFRTLKLSDARSEPRIPLNAPSHTQATRSAKLSALHARLSLPAKLPLQTLARCLIDPSVDSRPGYNNAPLALLGQDLLGYYTSEHVICHYPRLPMPVLFAAQYAYVGPATLASMRSEWGVEVVAAPGQEVDPGLLQLKRMAPGNAMSADGRRRLKDMPQARRLGSGRRNEEWNYRRSTSSRIVYDDQFGDLQTDTPSPEDMSPYPGAPIAQPAEGAEGKPSDEAQQIAPETSQQTQEVSMHTEPTTVEAASASFIRALAGALYLHAGSAAAKAFHKAHVLSRQLELHQLFNFTHPTRDLSRLCAREGFEPPVARMISETGRLSRSPVFVVGVYSGDDKLGEGAGSSLNEGRIRAAAAALRSWYLYSPPDTEIVVPSDVEGVSEGKKAWKPQLVDMGEIVT